MNGERIHEFGGEISDARVHPYCLSAEEVAREFIQAGRLKHIRTYIWLVEAEGKYFLSGGSDYRGPIVSGFVRTVLWLTKEMSKYLDEQRT